ncbi:protein kinase C delta type-like isoform X2 [Ranitomeya variabilis]|uniref:protein kinase C delta type-like isoform X2 n=1 Tax=Ranitomeya variabilis TaxID=490064 RepID=UPI004057273E
MEEEEIVGRKRVRKRRHMDSSADEKSSINKPKRSKILDSGQKTSASPEMEREDENVIAQSEGLKNKRHLESSDDKSSIKKPKRKGKKRKRPDSGRKMPEMDQMDKDVLVQSKGPKNRRISLDCSEEVKTPIIKTISQKKDDPGGSGCSGVRPSSSSTSSHSIKERLLFHHVLGFGSFGKVLMAEDTLTGQEFAVKIISKRLLLAVGDSLDVMVERRVLHLASGSPFLVHADFGFQTKMNIFLGMEYISWGNFYQLLHMKGPLDITNARFYAAELVCGIQFLHSEGVIHRDLKPENILVAETGHIKITDYGLALDNMHGDQTATGFAGTEGYMAPEILDMEEYNAGVDWYSFGVILNEMLTSECNYHPALFDESSSGAKDIIEQLLQEDPVQRLGVNGNVREHHFFHRIDWVAVEALRMPPPYIPVPTKPKPRFRAFKLDKIQAAETPLSITPEDQAVFRGFSFNN